MKKITILLIMMGLVAVTACSSNEANMKADEPSAPMSNDQMSADKEQMNKSDAEQVTPEKMTSETKVAVKEKALSNKISICKNGSNIRTISVIYKQGESTSCEVTYEKSTGVKTLWNAKSDLSYCDSKASEFVKKQESWG